MKHHQAKEEANTALPVYQLINPLLPTGGHTWAEFWKQQAKILDSMEKCSDGWFERRHAGTEKAHEAAKRAAEADSVLDVAREMQLWSFGSMQRVVEDYLAFYRHMTSMLDVVTPPATGGAEAAAPDVADDGKQKRSTPIPVQAA